MSDVRNVIIIGGGPAGYTAALYSARANLQPLVIEGFNWGGQLMITSDVENYPGYADGVMGPTMMQDFRRQAERFGAEFLTDDVTRVDFSERPFRVYVGNDEYPRRQRHRRHGRERPPARARVRAAAAGPRRLVLRHLRRLVLPRQGRHRGRRRRLGARGGDVHQPLREQGLPRASARGVPGLADHGRPSPRGREDRVRPQQGGRRGARATRRSPACGCATPSPARSSELETDGFFVAIGHDPNTALFLDQLDHEADTGYLVDARPSRPRRTSRASSPPVTSRITSTGRRSPLPARAARPRSTPSGSSPPSGSAAPARCKPPS